MNNFKVKWKNTAEYELNKIVQYIIDQGAPEAAEKLRQKIRDTAEDLSFSPYRVFFNKKRGFRKCRVGEYIILFRLVENTTPKQVIVARVIHGRRNLRKLIQ